MAASGRPEPAGTAVVIPVIFMVVFFVFDLVGVLYTYTVMADAVNEGVRYAMVHAGGDVAGLKQRSELCWHVIAQR